MPMSLSQVAEKMRDIDVAMLQTHTENGEIASRPMSNNRDVAWDGESYYFTYEDTLTVSDIEADPKVGLAFQGPKAFALALSGTAELIRDKAVLQKHWNPDLDHWFEDGVDTEGIVLIKVSASRVHYWDGMDSGEVTM